MNRIVPKDEWKKWNENLLPELVEEPLAKIVPSDVRDFANRFLDAMQERLKLRAQVDIDPREQAIARLWLVAVEEGNREVYIPYHDLRLSEALQLYREADAQLIASEIMGEESGQNLAYMIGENPAKNSSEWRKHPGL